MSQEQCAIIATDRDLNITVWNKAAESIYGWRRDEVICSRDSTKIRNQVLEVLTRDEITSCLLEEGSWTGEAHAYKKDGSKLDICIDITVLWDSNSKFNGIITIHRETVEKNRPKNNICNTGKEYAGEDASVIIKKLHNIINQFIQAIVSLSEAKDPYTAGHQRRVAQLVSELSKILCFGPDRLEGLMMASFVHDIGKILVPVDILSKPGALTEVEFEIIRNHSQSGYNILRTIDFPWPIAQIVFQHHERLNGSGYPSGLRGDKIMLEAKVLAVADVVEAMVSHRPYRPALGVEKALEEITQNIDLLYDSKVVEACVELFKHKGFVFN